MKKSSWKLAGVTTEKSPYEINQAGSSLPTMENPCYNQWKTRAKIDRQVLTK
jgi:hypothetical protein